MKNIDDNKPIDLLNKKRKPEKLKEKTIENKTSQNINISKNEEKD